MKVTDQYIKRLIELAEEIQKFHWCSIEGKQMAKVKELEYNGKINHLIGYILSLKEL